MHNKLTGTISLNVKGKGFVRIEGREDDVPVEPEDIGIALPGDTVEIETYTGFKGLTYGHVTSILERKKTQFVGTVYKHPDEKKSGFILVPDDRRSNITIAFTSAEGADLGALKENLKAIAKITDWTPEDGRAAKGALIRIIGEKGNNNVEMESIVLERGFDTTFDPEVIKEAEEAAKEYSSTNPPAEEIASRRDMRGVFTCTIDPIDAKDFDDALSIRPLPEGCYEIGIHIADVAHFVRPGTVLDREARKRAFSVYLVDRTIPMLPSVLSNGMCSLNPNEDRFAFSTIFKISKDGKMLDKWFGRTIIHSDKRLSYEEAQDVLNQVKDGTLSVNPEDTSSWHKAPYAVELSELNRLAKIMLKARQINGSIDFETTEIKFKLDEEGRPIAVYKKERLDAHKLVEEYMLLANREVAQFISEKNKEAKTEKFGVYRIHARGR